MIVLSTLVLVQQYFNRRRAMAAGIAVSGYSFGSLAAGPVIRVLIDAYSWRGTLMLIAGIFLHIAVFGSFFRPLVECKKLLPLKGENTSGTKAMSLPSAEETHKESNGRVSKKQSSVDRGNHAAAVASRAEVLETTPALVDCVARSSQALSTFLCCVGCLSVCISCLYFSCTLALPRSISTRQVVQHTGASARILLPYCRRLPAYP
jgi:MFS family permease